MQVYLKTSVVNSELSRANTRKEAGRLKFLSRVSVNSFCAQTKNSQRYVNTFWHAVDGPSGAPVRLSQASDKVVTVAPRE